MIHEADYILLRKSVTKEILRHKKELNKRMDAEVALIRCVYDSRLRELSRNCNELMEHLLVKRNNENKFIEEIDELRKLVNNLKAFP